MRTITPQALRRPRPLLLLAALSALRCGSSESPTTDGAGGSSLLDAGSPGGGGSKSTRRASGGNSGSSGSKAGSGGAVGPEGGANGAGGSSAGGGTSRGGGGGAGGAAPLGAGGGGSTGTATSSAAGDELFVSTAGDDANSGTRDRPFKTLSAAQSAVRSRATRGKVPITVTVESGTYYVGKTLVFTPADSGTMAAPVTYRGNGAATLSGGAKLDLTWSEYKNGILQATVPAPVSSGRSFDMLFLNGERQVLARYPNYKSGVVPFGGGSADAVSSGRVATWAHSPVGGYVHGLHGMNWGSEHYVITGVDASHNLTLDGPYCNARPSGLMNGSQVVENIFDELDAPGEWYFDRAAGVLYVYPPTGVDLASATVEVSGIETIAQLSGSSTAPVQWVVLDGFHYMHTSRTFAKCNETILRSDWQIYRGGTVFVSGAEDSAIEDSYFDNVGGNAVFVSGYNRRVTVASNQFVGTGASAILFMGLSSAVRNPLFGYYAGNTSVADLDKTPGPKTADYPAECVATDNLIHDLGDPQKQVAGVGIDIAQDITVSHNSIYSVPRAGINIGDGCFGGHVIEYNDVFDTVLETGDHGAFNSWGRDRYWDSSVSAIESRVASYSGGTPLYLLDAVKPITIKNNRWRCDHGWDVDLDDGSTNYVITNNLFLSGGLKWREGYSRTGDNNLFAETAKMSVHVWPRDNLDVFTHNIFAGYDAVNPDGFGKTLDYNLFTSAQGLSAARAYGIDAHSASGSAGYVDAAHGDFTLSSSSALALGIKSLPADSYGVLSLSLRAQARTPYFGASTETSDAGPRDTTVQTWRGASVKNLVGLDERSATGIGSDVGVLFVSVPSQSQSATDGFQALDVILQWGGQSVASWDDLSRLYAATTTGQKVAVGIHRLQTDTTIEITR